MAANNRQRLNNHLARPEQRGTGQQCRQNHHHGKNHAGHVVAHAAAIPCALHKLVNVLLPGVKAVIKRRLRRLYRRGHKVRELVVLKPGRLVIQIAVPLLKVLLHGSFQRFPFFADVLLCGERFELRVGLFKAVARRRHQRLDIIRRITQRG